MLLVKWVVTGTEIAGRHVLKDGAEGWENMEFNYKFDISRETRIKFEVENLIWQICKFFKRCDKLSVRQW